MKLAAASSGEPSSDCDRINLGQRFQSTFASDHGARAALGLVRRVQVFERGHRLGGIDGGLEFIGQFALLLDGLQNGGATLINGTQADDLVRNDAHLLVVKRAGHFFAVAGDKRDGVAFVQQADGCIYLGGFGLGQKGDFFSVGHGGDFTLKAHANRGDQEYRGGISSMYLWGLGMCISSPSGKAPSVRWTRPPNSKMRNLPLRDALQGETAR